MTIEDRIIDLLVRRGPGKTICPSEVARAMATEWRPLMPEVRDVAYAMAAVGRLRVLQKGMEVDPSTARGPIRLALPE
ncbi:MAG: DUF3253 domain-containing protein [Pseudomonadota bacterium]